MDNFESLNQFITDDLSVFYNDANILKSFITNLSGIVSECQKYEYMTSEDKLKFGKNLLYSLFDFGGTVTSKISDSLISTYITSSNNNFYRHKKHKIVR